MSKNRIKKLKKRKIIHRFRTRKSAEASVDRKEQDVYLIDLVLQKLYNQGDKQTASVEEDVLKPNKIDFTDAGSERLWDVLLSTGLVHPVIGFGRAGRLSLTNDGYQLMNKFGSYKTFLDQREQQARAGSQTVAMPQQFILTQRSEMRAQDQEEEKHKGTEDKSLDKDEKTAASKE